MLSRCRRRSPRYAVSVAALAVAGVLGACSTTDETSEPSERERSADLAATSSSSPVTCDPAPDPPTEVQTFTFTQAPLATVPDVAIADVQTNCGTLRFELTGAVAPETVASFILLGNGGFWVDSPCHRLVDANIHVLQCGDPTGTGRGGPGYTFGVENAPVEGLYPRGTIAMARSQDPNSNGSQFFIVFEDTILPPELGGYTTFGTVTSGMDIVDYIAAEGVDGGGVEGMPAQPISITGVEVEEEAKPS